MRALRRAAVAARRLRLAWQAHLHVHTYYVIMPCLAVILPFLVGIITTGVSV